VQRANEPQNPQKLARKLMKATMEIVPATAEKLSTIGLMHSFFGLCVTSKVAKKSGVEQNPAQSYFFSKSERIAKPFPLMKAVNCFLVLAAYFSDGVVPTLAGALVKTSLKHCL
jgi:hypothetical protein